MSGGLAGWDPETGIPKRRLMIATEHNTEDARGQQQDKSHYPQFTTVRGQERQVVKYGGGHIAYEMNKRYENNRHYILINYYGQSAEI